MEPSLSGGNSAADAYEFMPQSVRVCKRLLDVIGSLVGILLFVLLFPFIAIAIKLDSRGAIFFTQCRIGFVDGGGRQNFNLIKFRTMVENAEADTGAVLAEVDDPRITKVGDFLRATRMDELPQFFQVFSGRMSLVGPRPERPELAHDLEHLHPYFEERTVGIKPGITGLAQIKMSYRECADDVPSKLAYDLGYALALTDIVSWFRTDISIILETIRLCVLGRSGG